MNTGRIMELFKIKFILKKALCKSWDPDQIIMIKKQLKAVENEIEKLSN